MLNTDPYRPPGIDSDVPADRKAKRHSVGTRLARVIFGLVGGWLVMLLVFFILMSIAVTLGAS